MYKYVLPPLTLLPLPIGRGNLISVETSLYAYMQDNLPDDKWTYLELSYGTLTELVRVEGTTAPNFLVVSRGRDGTKPLAFPQGATVRYVPTAEAVRDTVTPSLTVDATGVISYYSGAFNVPPLSIVGLGGALSGGVFTSPGQGCGTCEDAPIIPYNLKPYRIVADGNFRITDDGSYRAYA
jgi:hypothetical protein